jgi:hypothetical protein
MVETIKDASEIRTTTTNSSANIFSKSLFDFFVAYDFTM